MTENNTEVIVAGFCGSEMSRYFNDAIVFFMNQFAADHGEENYQIFDGTGVELGVRNNYKNIPYGLFFGDRGVNNCHYLAKIAVEWFIERVTKSKKITTVGMVTYSRGMASANLAAHLAKKYPELKNIRFVLFSLDPVVGPFANIRMVPPISSNVGLYAALFAKYSLGPGYPFFLSHFPICESESTLTSFALLDVDHAAASALSIALLNPEEFFFTSKGMEQERKLIVGTMIAAFTKIGVKFKTEEFNKEKVISEWIKIGLGEVKKWQPSHLHLINRTRKYHKEGWILRRLFILSLTALCAYYLPSPHHLSAMLAITLFLIATIQAILAVFVPVTKLAQSFLPQQRTDDHQKKEIIRERVEKFLKPFDDFGNAPPVSRLRMTS